MLRTQSMRIGQFNPRGICICHQAKFLIRPNAFALSNLWPLSLFSLLYNAIEAPIAFLGPLQNLLSLLCEVGLAAVADNVFEEDRLPGLLVLLPLPGFFSLGFLQGHLYFGCLGKLLGEDGLGDASPQAE